MTKKSQKQFAIQFRKQGLTYSEILKKIPVAKSTLSLWLRRSSQDIKTEQRITKKKRQAQLKGAMAKRNKRIQSERKIIIQSRNEVGAITKRDLFILGIALYWAEGSKQSKKNVSQGVTFSNSDPKMICLFLVWLKRVCGINEKDIIFELYIHQSQNLNLCKKYWTKKLGISQAKLNRIYLKKHTPLKGKNYKKNYGLIRITVRRSTNFNRKIRGWVEGIRLGVV